MISAKETSWAAGRGVNPNRCGPEEFLTVSPPILFDDACFQRSQRPRHSFSSEEGLLLGGLEVFVIHSTVLDTYHTGNRPAIGPAIVQDCQPV